MKPGHWTVPREWAGDRCFILCGGDSVRAQRSLIPQLQGRIIAIKQSVVLRLDADVMFLAGRDDADLCAPYFPLFHGRYLVSRQAYPGFPSTTRCLSRSADPTRLSEDPTELAGYDAGASAINLAYLFGAADIVLLGYDMSGGRWFNGEIAHPRPYPSQLHFDRHLQAIGPLAADLRARGVRVWNCSPTSVVPRRIFERAPLARFVDPVSPTSAISPAYLDQQRALHAAPRGYGGKGSKWAAAVAALARAYQATSVLDYGCGQGSLGIALRAAPLGLEVRDYDPAIPGKDGPPEPADLVVCTDVLEHIEPDRLDVVLTDLRRMARRVVFAVIATRPSNKTLPDGRNAHLILEDAAWWVTRLTGAGFTAIPGPTLSSASAAREVSLVLQ